jgi:hypothetical protein
MRRARKQTADTPRRLSFAKMSSNSKMSRMGLT